MTLLCDDHKIDIRYIHPQLNDLAMKSDRHHKVILPNHTEFISINTCKPQCYTSIYHLITDY